jgi:alkyl hydroperoxide reductase subunit AhpC
MPCQAHLVELRDAYDRIRQTGAEVLVITMSRPEVLRRFLEQTPFPFPVAADPERAAYRQFGLGRTSYWSFFRPGVLYRYLRLIGRGGQVKPINEGEDALQLGGDFILDKHQRLRFSYYSREATDRPVVALLLHQLAQVGQSE